MSTTATGYVLITYRDANGTHHPGEAVEVDPLALARLVKVGILADEPPEIVRAHVTRIDPGTLPEPTPEPQEGVKKAATPKRRRPARQKES